LETENIEDGSRKKKLPVRKTKEHDMPALLIYRETQGHRDEL
jgi:hypothetical protein